MQIDKKIIRKLLEVLEDLKKTLKDSEIIKGNNKKEKERAEKIRTKLIKHFRFLSMLELRERVVLQVLMKRCDNQDSFQISTGRLALFLNTSSRVIFRCLSNLEKRGFVHYLDSYGEKGGKLEAWTYKLNWHEMANARVRHNNKLKERARKYSLKNKNT